MEQVEGGDLVVNKGGDDTATSTEAPPTDDERDLRAVPGFDAGHKLARSSLDALLAAAAPAPPKPDTAPSHERTGSGSGMLAPVTVCPVYMRIQPLLAPLPGAVAAEGKQLPQHLFFLLLLCDPEHDLEHSTLTQAMPGSWLDIPFEENEWVVRCSTCWCGLTRAGGCDGRGHPSRRRDHRPGAPAQPGPR